MSRAHGHHHLSHAERSSLSTHAVIASIALALFLLGLKGWAASETQSMAMLGSLADTALDLVASLVTLWGVRVAAQPADSDHRFARQAEALVAIVRSSSLPAAVPRGPFDPAADRRRADPGCRARDRRLASRNGRHVCPDSLPALGHSPYRLGGDLDRPAALCVRPAPQRVCDRRPRARSIRRVAGIGRGAWIADWPARVRGLRSSSCIKQ